MREENTRMQEYLAKHGIHARVKYIWNSSLKGCWRLYNPSIKWNPELESKLTALGFKGFDGKPLDKYSGNGGLFSVFVRGHKELLEGQSGEGEPDVERNMLASEILVLAKELLALDVFQQHQKNIAIKTLKMSDMGANIMGGMSKDEARAFLKSIGYSNSQIAKIENL